MNQPGYPPQGVKKGTSPWVIVGIVAAVGFLVVVAAMGVGVFALRRAVVAEQSGTPQRTSGDQGAASTPGAAASASKPTGFFVIATDDISLYDSEESNKEASRLAAKKDERGFARNHLAHGVPVARGTRVKRLSGGVLTVEVETVDTGIRGWTDREFLKPE